MFDETKVFESDYDVPNANNTIILYNDFSFEENHLGFISCTVNGGIKRKNTWNKNYLLCYLGSKDGVPEANVSSSYVVTKLNRIFIGEQDSFANHIDKSEKQFLGGLWSGQTLYSTPYRGQICLCSYVFNDSSGDYYYSTSSITLQAGTTISLKAYQLNFS